MITAIKGVLAESTPLRAVVDLNGISYEVHVPVTTAEKLPPVGSAVKLHTLVIYREDSQTLYGFATQTDRDFFKLLIDNVTGVGPKMAIGILSRLSVSSLESAIRMGDIGTLSNVQGIGKKMAERLVVELKGKVGSVQAPQLGSESSEAAPEASPHRDAVSALIALGFKPADADVAVRRASLALGSAASTEALIKKALG